MLLPKRLRAVRFVLVLVMVILPALAVAVASVQVTADIVAPEAERRAELAGRTVAKEVEHALDLGIPLRDLVGMDTFLGAIFRETAEVSWMAVTDAQGSVVHVEHAAGVTEPPRPGSFLAPPADGAAVLALPLRAQGAAVGTLQVGWRVAAAAGPRQAVLSTLLLVLVGAIALAAEWGHLIWGVSVGGPLRALEDTLARLRQGDLSVAPKLADGDALGRVGRGLSRLLRRVNFRLEELGALAEDVAATVPAAARPDVLRLGRRPAEGWTLAPVAAQPLRPRRQLALYRFVLFSLAGALFIHVPSLLAAGGWHDQPAVLLGFGTALATALLLMRVPLSSRLPGRISAVTGAVVAGLVLHGWPVAPGAYPITAGLMLGGAFGILLQPLRSAARAEGSGLGELASNAAGAIVSGALAGLALGGLAQSFLFTHFLDTASAVTLGMAAMVVLVGLSPLREDSQVARWPNAQETAAVLLRWPLLVLASGPGAALRLLIAVVLIGALSQVAVRGLPADTLTLTALGTVLAVAWWTGQAAGRLVVRRGRMVSEGLWTVMLLAGLIALVLPYDATRAALWGIGFLAFLGGAVTPLRQAAAAETARRAGHGLGTDRVERTIALLEVAALAMAPVLVSLQGELGVGGLTRPLALVVLVGVVVAWPVIGPGGGALRGTREARP